MYASSAGHKVGDLWGRGVGVYASAGATQISKPPLQWLASLPYAHWGLNWLTLYVEALAPVAMFFPIPALQRQVAAS